MKTLKLIALVAGIFAVTGFGVSEWENVIKKAVAAGVPGRITRAWNQSLYDTGLEWQELANSLGYQWKSLSTPIVPKHTDADLTEMRDGDD